MDPIFEHPVFDSAKEKINLFLIQPRRRWTCFWFSQGEDEPVLDSAREKMKRFIRQLEKSQEAFENSLYACFKCGSNNIFSVAKQVRSADEGTSVFSECPDCHNKWRDGWYSLCDKSPIKIFMVGVVRRLHQPYQYHRNILGHNDNVKWVFIWLT